MHDCSAAGGKQHVASSPPEGRRNPICHEASPCPSALSATYRHKQINALPHNQSDTSGRSLVSAADAGPRIYTHYNCLRVVCLLTDFALFRNPIDASQSAIKRQPFNDFHWQTLEELGKMSPDARIGSLSSVFFSNRVRLFMQKKYQPTDQGCRKPISRRMLFNDAMLVHDECRESTRYCKSFVELYRKWSCFECRSNLKPWLPIAFHRNAHLQVFIPRMT